MFSKEPSAFVMKAAELLPESAVVADLACGEGRNAVALALKSFKVKAYDFIPEAIERTKALAESSRADLEAKVLDLDFFMPDLMTFDAIVITDFRPPATLLKNLIRGLKKNGLLIMETYLIGVCRNRQDIEVFETFKPGELLNHFGGPQMNSQCVYYNELGDFQTEPEKVQMIVKKTEML